MQSCRCDVCGGPFTKDQWELRHGDDTDIHADCCDCWQAEAARLQARHGRPFTAREVSGSCVNPTQQQIAEAQ